MHLVESLPRTGLGKVQRHLLQGSREGTGGDH
jgi:acyl-coenzyme A synthetase/AMP-(fatty) acid ligase